jgi:DMSO/TMAO reductase YedYZ molybdopterin-dependent catalytic subunit
VTVNHFRRQDEYGSQMHRPIPQDGERAYGRRTFLAVTAAGLSSLVWGRPVWRLFSGAVSGVESALPAGLVPEGWRIYTVAATMPVFDPRTWRLQIEGLVERPRTLTYADLRALPKARQVSTFHCVTGWTVKNVHWGGVRFRDLLAAARPKAGAHVLTFVSAERPYVDTLTLEQAELHDAMLAYEMDGKPLPREHGAPVRVVIPEMYGYKNVKWVERIVVGEVAQPGFWEQRGYDVNAWVGRSNGY